MKKTPFQFPVLQIIDCSVLMDTMHVFKSSAWMTCSIFQGCDACKFQHEK